MLLRRDRSIVPKLAHTIVEIYRHQALEIIDQYPDLLLHIRGMSQGWLRRITEIWREQPAVREIVPVCR